MLLLRFWKPFLIAVVILVLCLIPSQNLERIDFFKISFQDLLAHLVMFFAFSFFFARDLLRFKSLHNNRRYQLILLVVFSMLFAVLTEMLQLAFPVLNRSASLGDLLFDLVGTVSGIFPVYLTKR